MEKINLTKYRLNHLIKYKLSKNVIATEGKIYYYPHKTNWTNEMKVLKMFYRDLTEDRVANIEFLSEYKKELESISSLVLPDALVSYYGKDRGIIMPYVENTNLADFLMFDDVDQTVKLRHLKEVGKILEEISLLRKYNSDLKDFAIGDLHEANTIIESSTNRIKFVDIDSAYTGSYISASKYLTLNINLESLSNKYSMNEDESIIPNEQTDLYCYHMMILNYMYRDNIADLPIDEFYYYLEYLKKIGMNKDFLESCSRLYTSQENINPKDYLDNIGVNVSRASRKIYEKCKDKIMNI